MSDAGQMHALADRFEELANHMDSVADQINEQAGHVLALKSELDEALNHHGAVYDDQSDTGDSTRGMTQGAEGELDEAHGQVAMAEDKLHGQAMVLRQAASDIREHAGRIQAALGG